MQVRELFRKNIQEELNSSYSFYAITAREGVNAEQFMQQNFQQLLGKVYTPYGDTGGQSYYSVALDNGERFTDENERTLSLLAPYLSGSVLKRFCQKWSKRQRALLFRLRSSLCIMYNAT